MKTVQIPKDVIRQQGFDYCRYTRVLVNQENPKFEQEQSSLEQSKTNQKIFSLTGFMDQKESKRQKKKDKEQRECKDKVIQETQREYDEASVKEKVRVVRGDAEQRSRKEPEKNVILEEEEKKEDLQSQTTEATMVKEMLPILQQCIQQFSSKMENFGKDIEGKLDDMQAKY